MLSTNQRNILEGGNQDKIGNERVDNIDNLLSSSLLRSAPAINRVSDVRW